jgi:hypothetical protein
MPTLLQMPSHSPTALQRELFLSSSDAFSLELKSRDLFTMFEMLPRRCARKDIVVEIAALLITIFPEITLTPDESTKKTHFFEQSREIKKQQRAFLKLINDERKLVAGHVEITVNS